MTLLSMENKESILCALKKLPSNIPPILEDYMQQISRNGQTMLPWIYVKPLILQKYNHAVESFPTDALSNDIEDLKHRVYGVLKRMDGIPFTIQRICELLCAPNRQYTRLDKYLRGLEKVCRVVSTVDPRGNKIHHEDPRFPSQAGLEECMTDDSLLSPNTSHSDGDDGTEEYGDIVSPESADTVVGASHPTPASPMWQMPSDTNPLSLGQTAGDGLIDSPPSDEAEPPLLRPIGQLEAFVQNIAADIPVSGSAAVPCVTTNSQGLLMKSSIAAMHLDINEDGDSLELERLGVIAAGGRSVDDGGDDQYPNNELAGKPAAAGLKRRAPVSVDEALASSLGSLVEQAAGGAYPTGGSTPVLDHGEEDRDAEESPAKRRRIAGLPGESDEDVPHFEMVESRDQQAADVPDPSPSLALGLHGSLPASVCSRPDTAQSSSTDSSSSSVLTDTSSVEPATTNSDEESGGSRNSDGSATQSD